MVDEGDRAHETGVSVGPGGCLGRQAVRLALLGFLGVIVLIVVAVIVVLALRANRNRPLNVIIYPGAQLLSQERLYGGFDHLQYTTGDPFEQVEAFYLARKEMDCTRLYRTVENRSGQEPLREGHYATRCQVDRSAYGITQFATVLIQPVYDKDERPTDRVIVDIQRYWGD